MNLRLFCFGVGLTSAASLALSLLFTRIFSVTMYYHFAFMIVSLSMLGIAISGVIVYLFPRLFRDERKPWQAGLFAGLIAPTAMVALRVAVENPMSVSLEAENVHRLITLYLFTALPFLASGFAIALAIARAKEHISRVYASDLLGAGLGCALMIPLVAAVGAPAAVLFVGAVAAAGGMLMALSCVPTTGVARLSAILAALCCVSGIYESAATRLNPARYRIAQGSKFLDESAVEFERWNAFSRITVSRGEHDYKWLHIDADAATRMYSGTIATDGFEAPRRFSETRVAALVYTLRHEGPALIIGPGGGSEVVSALRAHVPRVVGAEVNPLIARTVMQQKYAAYNGNLYRNEHVELHVDDGRSFVRRSTEQYSSIEATLVDTWAATAAGAFALTENNLYTAEAFVDYLEHLQPQGVLSMTRWYTTPPTEFVRLLGLGREALRQLGVPEEQQSAHFFVAADNRVATMLLKRSPFAVEEAVALERECARSGLHVLFHPITARGDANLVASLTQNPDTYYAAQSADVSPSTDAKPFFFYTLRGPDFMTLLARFESSNRTNLGLVVLQVVLLVSTGLTILLVLGPLALLRRQVLRENRATKLRVVLYFIMIGLAYILVELGMMQKFVLFLGHPVYALSVVIASLLVSSGIGSALSAALDARLGTGAAIRFGGMVLCGLLALYIVGLSPVFRVLLHLPVAGRIAIAAVLVGMLGTCMGLLLPLGVRVASRLGGDLVPWAFGLNGAMSVIGSTLAVVISMNWGFTMTLAAGLLAYAGAATTLSGCTLRTPAARRSRASDAAG